MADQTTTATAGVLGGLPPLPRKPLNNSVIAAEQAYRNRKGLPLLTEEDMEALRQGVHALLHRSVEARGREGLGSRFYADRVANNALL